MEALEVFEPAVAEEEATPEPEAPAPAKGDLVFTPECDSMLSQPKCDADWLGPGM